MEWTQGYIADINYTHGFYGELSPEQLALAVVVKGGKPPALDSGFTYFELGCGQGFNLNVLAAANPQGRFYGNDFNPSHIAGAQALAEAAGLKNLTLYEKSFQELSTLDLPRFDFICLHGIYSWVNLENRKAIVDFLRTHLKPGGIVYISYNCLPGWSVVAPIRRLMTEHASVTGGTLPQRIEQALTFTARLNELKTGFFAPNPLLDARLAQIQGSSRNYLAHEYFNKEWSPFYHADVVRDLAEAKLTFVGPSGYTELMEFLMLNENAAKVLAEVQDPGLRETIRDFLLNQQFRKDVFTRGKVAQSSSEQRETLSRKQVLLSAPRAEAVLTVRFPVGERNLLPEIYNPVLDELEKGTQTIKQLTDTLASRNLNQEQVQQAVLVLLATGYVVLAPGSLQRKDSTDRLNAVVLERALQNDDLQYLASPITGTGVATDLVDRLFLLAQRKGEEPIKLAWDAIRSRNQVLLKDGKGIATPEENLQEMAIRYQQFSEKRVPRYQKLGLI